LYLSAKILAFRRVRILSTNAERKLAAFENQRMKVSAAFQKVGAEFGLGAASRTKIRKPATEQTSFGFEGDGTDSAFARASRLNSG